MQSNTAGFRVGDLVRSETSCRSANLGATYTVWDDSKNHADEPLAIGIDKNYGCHCTTRWTLIKPESNQSNMNLSEKFALVFKGEPEKSFIKAGVMNADESLTTDGQKLFMAYLLKKNGDDFKTTVVDPILAEEEAK